MCASSPHCRLGYWSIQQGAETSIQPSEPVILHSQLHTVTCVHTHTHTQHPGVSDEHTNLTVKSAVTHVPVTYRSLCISAGWLSHRAAAGSSRTLWGRWCRSRFLLRCHLSGREREAQPWRFVDSLFLNVLSGKELPAFVLSIHRRVVLMLGHALACLLCLIKCWCDVDQRQCVCWAAQISWGQINVQLKCSIRAYLHMFHFNS